METDPKGQLGGLDTTDEVRKRLATESLSYLCPACGKSNADIIRECSEQSEANPDTSAGNKEIDVPSDLRMSWKDELAPGPGTQTQRDQSTAQPIITDHRPDASVDSTEQIKPAEQATSPRTQSSAPGPALSTRTAQSQPQPQPQPQNVGVPRWLDQLIFFLFVVLAAAILHRLLSSTTTTI